MVLKSTLDQNDASVDTYDVNGDLISQGANYSTLLNLKPGNESSLTELQRTQTKDIYREFYETYHDRELHSYNEDIPIGCPVILDGVPSFDDVWDEANFIWDDAIDANANLRVT